jgi:glycosyltransferase involved in cell wall biosynthesis
VFELKILLTAHQFLPEYASGTEILTYSVAAELKRRGHDVAVFTGFPARQEMADAERFDKYEYEGIEVFRFNHAFVPMGGQRHVHEIEYCNFLAARFFNQLVRERKPDVIHFFHLSRLGAALIDVALSARIPAYYTPTDFWAVCPTSQLLLDGGRVCDGPLQHAGNCVKHIASLTRGKRVARLMRVVPDRIAEFITRSTANGVLPQYPLSHEITALSRRKDFIVRRLNVLKRIITATQFMSDVLVANGVLETQIVKLAFGIDISYYEKRHRNDSVKAGLTFGFIGTLAPHKGCHLLLNAVRNLHESDVLIKIYGRGSDFHKYYEELQRIAKGDPRIQFCGTFPNSEIGKVLAGIDVLVVPSLWYENSPLVIYSALAAGCPVLASNYPGMSEVVINGRNGLVFRPGDQAELRDAIRRLCDEKDLLPHLRENCNKPKSTSQYVAELLELYEIDVAPSRPSRASPSWVELEALAPVA